MGKKANIRFLLLCIAALSMAVLVSCAKKTPEPAPGTQEQAAISEQEAAEAGKAREAREAAEKIREQELEAARKQAEQKARQQAAEARQRFLSEKVYFGFDDSSLTPEAREVLRRKVDYLRAHPNACVIIEGHCDERGTDEYNLALGSRRAESVKNFLVKAGISASRLRTISYGEERPAVMGHNEEAWAKNRRAEFEFCSNR